MIRDYTMILYRGNMCATPAESSKRVCFLRFNVIQKDYVDRV